MTLRCTFLFLASIGLAAACGGAGDNTTGDSSGGTSGSTAGDNGGTTGDDSSGGTTGDDGGTGSAGDGGTGGTTTGNTGGNSAGNNGGSDGGTGGTTTGVSILVEPNGNSGTELVNAIKAAKTSVHMTMYLLSSTEVISALVDRRNSGVEVKVVLNQNFPSGGGDNSSSFATLQNNGVSVVWAPSAFTYTHEKCVIIDGSTAWIMTMNATFSSPTDNREYLAIDTFPADVTEAEKIFQADFANSSINLSGTLLVAPVNARQGLEALIATATKTVDVEGEEFSDTGVVNALVAAKKAGIAVRVIVANSTPAASQTTAINTVKAAGIKVVKSGGTSSSSTSSNPYIHAKALVVDGVRGYVGSANFSGGSLGYNREVGLVVDNATEIAKVQTTINTDFSKGTAL